MLGRNGCPGRFGCADFHKLSNPTFASNVGCREQLGRPMRRGEGLLTTLLSRLVGWRTTAGIRRKEAPRHSLRGKPDYHLDGGSADFVISAVPPNRLEKNPVGADNHDRKIALLILHIPG